MIKPSRNIVLVKVDSPEQQDASGIYIQEEWKTLPPTGVVTGAGPDVSTCKVGDRVFFERFSAVPTPFGEDIRACREDAILAVYDEKG